MGVIKFMVVGGLREVKRTDGGAFHTMEVISEGGGRVVSVYVNNRKSVEKMENLQPKDFVAAAGVATMANGDIRDALNTKVSATEIV